MSFLSKLFGGGAASEPEAETYEGFSISAVPEKEGGRYRVGAMIEKEVDGEKKVHHLIRADVLESLDEAKDVSIRKAKQMIDEQGDRLFR